jgi:Ca2+-binding EF-hand superfamily protein
MTRIFIATAVALGTVATIALAQPTTPPAATGGKVMERSEVQTMVREHFTRLDSDKDGAVTTAEIAARHGKMGGHRVTNVIQKDGTQVHVSRDGLGDPAAAFDRLDANKDGAISRDEFAKGRQIRIEKRIEKRAEGRDKMRMHHRGGMMGARMIVMADSNRDGRITLGEAETMALQHFDKMDANRDGRVTPEERRAGRPMMMHRMEKPTAG